MKSVVVVLALALGLIPPSIQASKLASPEPLDRVAALAQDQQLPVMLLFTSDGCGYCERLKNELLLPMLHQGELKGRAILREVDINQGGKLTDFDGERIRRRVFVSRYKVFATPTLAILDPRGDILLPSLIGYNDAEQYREALAEALERAPGLLALDRNTALADK